MSTFACFTALSSPQDPLFNDVEAAAGVKSEVKDTKDPALFKLYTRYALINIIRFKKREICALDLALARDKCITAS